MSLELSVLRVAPKFKLAASSCSLWFHIFRVGACQRQSATHNAVLRLALRHTHSLQLWFTGQSAFGDFLGEWSCLSVESRLRSLAEPCDPNLGTLKFPRFLFLRWLDSFEMEKCKRVRRYGHCIISAEHSKTILTNCSVEPSVPLKPNGCSTRRWVNEKAMLLTKVSAY